MSGDVKFKIQGKTYDTATIDEISLRDVVLFNSQAADMGLGVTWSDIERISGEMAEAGDDASHPEALVMFAVTIWAARRIAGDDVTLEQALDVPMKDIEIREARKAPKDHQPKKKSSRSTRLASAPATVDSEPSVTTETTPPTSTASSVSA